MDDIYPTIIDRSTHLPIYGNLSTDLSIHLSTYLPIYPSVDLSIYLSKHSYIDVYTMYTHRDIAMEKQGQLSYYRNSLQHVRTANFE